jgi:2-keto-3-deoxy-L-rhamnonate aldolase RhmA
VGGGLGGVCLARCGRVVMTFPELIDSGRVPVGLIVRIDSIETLEIVATPGLDAIFIGMGDLSLDIGLPRSDPEFAAAMETVRESAERAGIAVGTIGDGPAEAARLVELVHDFILIGDDLGCSRAP